ncbi:hypothetical protein ACFPLB_07475 [Aquamicrobium segne]|uniref:Transposase n=1 Tax=Aquamicrobium segne TaxID=469547 RepID=A0ABW0GVW1_9HYPH
MCTNEIRLDELLSDPMVQLLMQRDRVDPKGLRWMLERAAARVSDPSLSPAYMVGHEGCEQQMCV